MTGIFPKGKGAGGLPGAAGGMPGMAGMAGMAGMSGMAGMGPPGMLAERQVPTTTSPGAPGGGAPPKFTLDPEQSAAIASARSCFCSATAPVKAAADTCIPSTCATATGAAEGYAKVVNGLCKGIAGYIPITAPPAAPAAATPAV